MARNKNNKVRKVRQGGFDEDKPMRMRQITHTQEDGVVDVLLQNPELFYFNINKWITSVLTATSIDMPNRAQLYDMYSSCMLDSHLASVVRKRKIAVSRTPIEFHRDGQPDEKIMEQIKSPWFRRFVKSTIDIQLYGFECYQFFKDEDGSDFLNFDIINHKHVEPVKKQILRYQFDTEGVPFDAFGNILLACDEPRSIGQLAAVVPWVLYKRNNVSDWAEFCQIFGIPIREYVYDAGDEDARRQLLQDARKQGACAVYIHPTGSSLNLIEPKNSAGSVDVFERFCRFCNEQISIAILGNTLTTGTGTSGSEALGKIHQDEEDELKADDRDAVLALLNYNLTDIFQSLGINTEGGEFVYNKTKDINPNAQVDVVMKLYSMGLPIDDDYLYDTFNISKPSDYEEQKRKMQEEEEANKRMRQAQIEATQTPQRDIDDNSVEEPENSRRLRIFNRFLNFFVQGRSSDTFVW